MEFWPKIFDQNLNGQFSLNLNKDEFDKLAGLEVFESSNFELYIEHISIILAKIPAIS